MVTVAKTPSSAKGCELAARSRNWLEWALIVVIFFIAGGAPAPHVNESHYLVKAKHSWDASYCPGDFFLDSADPHVTFYGSIGWLTRFFSLTTAAWIGRAAAWALLAVGWLRLSRVVTNVPWAAALGAALWVTLLKDGNGNFAGEWVVGGLEAKCFAYGFVLLGLAAMARGAWRTTWIWFGAAAAFHVLVGAWAVLAALGVWAIEPRARRAPLPTLLPGLAAGGALALFGLLPGLALERGVDPATAQEAARIYVFDRLPHHLAPLSLPHEELFRRIMRFGMMSAIFLTLWVWTLRRPRRLIEVLGERSAEQCREATVRILRFAGLALAGACVGLLIERALFNYPHTAARILRYYWFRQADVAVPLAIAICGAQLVVALLQRRRVASTALAIVPIVWCGGYLARTAYGRFESPIPPAATKVDNFPAWREACEWVDQHAPADARFLIPRWGQSFKWYASRADVANHKDVPQDAASVVEWRQRCRELFPTVEGDEKPRVLASPEELGTARVRELAQQYGASHVIARSYPPLDLPIVFPAAEEAGTRYYTIYETGVPAGGEAP